MDSRLTPTARSSSRSSAFATADAGRVLLEPGELQHALLPGGLDGVQSRDLAQRPGQLGGFGRRSHQHPLGSGQLSLQVGGRVFGHDTTAVDDEHPIADLLGLGQDVSGKHDRAIGPQTGDQLAYLDDLSRVQSDGGLVQDQDFRLVQQRLR
jgi:hypothetical protein